MTDTIGHALVTADRDAQVLPSQILSGKSLERRSDLSVADAVMYFSGVQIKDWGGIGGLKTVNVRSLGSQQVAVYYDGFAVDNAQNGQVDLGRFSLENMEAVALYNGHKDSGLQGAREFASASSVYLKPKVPVFAPGKKNNLRIKALAGSSDTWSPSVVWDHILSKSVSNSLSVSYLQSSGRYRFSYTKKDGYDTTAVRSNSDIEVLRLEEALNGSLRKGRWNARAGWYRSERGYPGAFVREEPGRFSHEDRQWDNDLFVQGGAELDLGKWRLSAKGKLAFSQLRYLSDPRLDVTTMYVDNTYRQGNVYASVSAARDITGWLRLSLATDLQFDCLEADLLDFAKPRRLTSYDALSLNFHKGDLRAGLSLLDTEVMDYTAKGSSKRDQLSPCATFSIPISRDNSLSFRGFYKHAFRMPTFNDLYYTFIGNANLDPETSDQGDLGLTFRKGTFRLNADAYYNSVDNKIVAVPTSNQFRWTMINLDHAEVLGFDLNGASEFRIADVEITPRLTYSFHKALDVLIPYIPTHSGSAVFTASWREYTLDYSFIYTGERYDSSVAIPENHILPWYTSDLSLSRPFKLRGCRSMATAQITNLLNQQYEVVRGYPMPGTGFRLILSVEI